MAKKFDGGAFQLWMFILICAAIPAIHSPAQEASPLRIAFLAAETREQDMGPHTHAAWECAKTIGDATLLLLNKEGRFCDGGGVEQDLASYDVLWHHQGDAIAYTAMYGGPALAAVRAFIEGGGGVLFSGGALAIIDNLGIEKEVRSQRRQIEHWRDPAAMIPVEKSHPAFLNLVEQDGVIWMSRGGCPAVADFYWGGPAEGMLLANTPEGVQRPLAEYGIGNGRMVLFGWRWPDYADLENPHRANLLTLTANLLAYLADALRWRPVIIRSQYPPAVWADFPGIGPPRWRALRLAIEDLARDFGPRYPREQEFLMRWEALRAEQEALLQNADPEAIASFRARFDTLQREALLANPLIDFERLFMIRRRADRLGLPMNYNGNDDVPPTGYGNTLIALRLPASAGAVETVFQPEGDYFIGDIDLHFDAEKLLLSIPDKQGRWGIAELNIQRAAMRTLPLIDEPDVHNYDACYLPDERIVFTSTAPFTGVPCVGGRSKVANLYLCDHNGSIRRLTNDQDHNWCPAVMNNGRILYQRWEYADIAHAFTRLLFHANPDGSGQMEYYGSNSFWPTALFFARPIPGHPTQVVAIAGGHHDAPRQGELVILDPALGRHETNGVVQRIPGYGEKVAPVILDGLIAASWPRFLHPYPLSGKYFLASCKPTKESLWGVYLVDVFDNFVLLHEESGWAMFEPIPWRKTPRPPVIPDVVPQKSKDATVLMTDVYRGPGLAGVARGMVKSLRLVGYDFTFHDLGGEPDRVGLDGPWDVKRILGTVPVEPDGSAHFRVPACTPISLQPLDGQGKALALMRSWMTAVSGETLSCVGCHEKQNLTGAFDVKPAAFRRPPSDITPWYGPPRGFSFEREVQPVLNAHCVRCHAPGGIGGADFSARPAERIPSAFQMHFSPAYMQLRRWVYTPTLESDAHLLPPRDFHADVSPLIQMLRDGHFGVCLDAEAWDRLITWIDLNAPYHGAWREVVEHDPAKLAAAKHGAERRRALHLRYAGIDEDPEAVYPPAELESPQDPAADSAIRLTFDVGAAGAPSAGPGAVASVHVALGDDVMLELVRIEAGVFTMGSDTAYANERPAHQETIAAPFLMGRFEISNRQYRCFKPHHDSGLETGEAYQFGDDERGFTLTRPEQPVVRVSWNEAMAFCEWLSEKTGWQFSLPSEAQWEYACRAGTTASFWYGGLDSDFGRFANLSDATHHTVYYPHVPTALPSWRPSDIRFDDAWRVSAPCGTFFPNPWGLYDMHGNAAEWTRSDYVLFAAPESMAPLASEEVRKVVRGGSWMAPPKRARASFRTHYAASQAIHDVGFRVVCEIPDP